MTVKPEHLSPLADRLAEVLLERDALKTKNTLIKQAAACLADCLYQLYEAAGLDKPESFDPDIEASRLIAALAAVSGSLP